MPQFVNVTTDALSVNGPQDHPDAHQVEPGAVLRVPGQVVETADAYVVGEGAKARAYAKALWELQPEPSKETKQTTSKEGGRS